MLGRKSSKTTEIYTHVAMKDLRKIRNPIDMMVKGEKMDDFAYTAKTEQKTNFIYTMLGDILLDNR